MLYFMHFCYDDIGIDKTIINIFTLAVTVQSFL